MGGLGARMQDEMSGGQQQRVALARVLVTQPKILLLDEPLSALDKNIREEMKFWIKELQSSLGITTIYVTHDQGEALTMSDRIAVMNDGHIAQIGSPREIYETPEDLFVAAFIGESNLLDVVVRDIGAPKGSVGIDGLSIPARLHPKLSIGQSAKMVLRPEHVRVISNKPEEGWYTSRATVVGITYQGATLRFALEFAGQSLFCETQNDPNAPQLKAGQTVEIAWPSDAALVLPEGPK